MAIKLVLQHLDSTAEDCEITEACCKCINACQSTYNNRNTAGIFHLGDFVCVCVCARVHECVFAFLLLGMITPGIVRS